MPGLENRAQFDRQSSPDLGFIDKILRKMQMCAVENQIRMTEWLAWAKEHADRIDPLYSNLPFEVDILSV